MPKPLSIEEVRARKTSASNLRVAASCSFNEAEINALDTVLNTLLRGGSVHTMRTVDLQSIAKKLPAMKAAVERQKQRREAVSR